MIPNIWKNKLASVVSPTAAAFQTSAATLSHETRFERLSNTFYLRVWRVRRQPFRTDEVRVSKTGGFSYILRGNPFARNEVRASRTAGFLRFYILGSDLFARNEQDFHKLTCSQAPVQSVTSKCNLHSGGGLKHVKPVVPHKSLAEVSRIGHYRRGELL